MRTTSTRRIAALSFSGLLLLGGVACSDDADGDNVDDELENDISEGVDDVSDELSEQIDEGTEETPEDG